jgi:tryptophanyl-tRNA synthetase
MSLRDGSKKMSKSDPSGYSRLTMTDGPDEIAQKIRKAKTDPLPLPETVDGFEGRPEAANLITIYAALADIGTEAVLSEFGGQKFSDFKKALTDLAVEKLGPVGQEMRRLMADPGHVDAVLKDGAERADALARPILREIYDVVGFLNVR